MIRIFRTLPKQEMRIMVWAALQQRFRKPVVQASLGLVGTFLLIAGLAALVLRPTLLTISGLIKEIQDEQKLISALEGKFQNLLTAQGMLEEIKDDLPRIDWAIPPGQEFEIFVKEIEVLARDTGLAAVEISQEGFDLTGGDDEAQKVNFLEVRLALGGSEDSVREFLAGLVKMDRLVVIKSANVSSVPPGRRQDEPYQVKGSVSAEIAYYEGVGSRE